MSICFVIQPFDKGRFDKRYRDVFQPAIVAAGVEPYRVDQDPTSVVPIEDIEAGIRRADVCFAEITTDNPNVWFELGFAIAARKPVIMACAEERAHFPFDVRHRHIIRYQSESTQDFEDLKANITQRIKVAIEKQRRLDTVDDLSPVAATQGLTEHELVALITIAAGSMEGDPITAFSLRQDMGRAGYTDVACALAIRGLERKAFIERGSGYDGNNEYWGFVASEGGLDWLDENRDRLRLKKSPTSQAEFTSDEDELPF
jgi:hypothetical protein